MSNAPRRRNEAGLRMGRFLDFMTANGRTKLRGNQRLGNIMGLAFQQCHHWPPVSPRLHCEVCRGKLPKQPRNAYVADQTLVQSLVLQRTLKEREVSRASQLLQLQCQHVRAFHLPVGQAKPAQVWLKNRGQASQVMQLLMPDLHVGTLKLLMRNLHVGTLNHGKLLVRSFLTEDLTIVAVMWESPFFHPERV